MWFFRAVAFDLDGTLATAERVGADVLSQIDRAHQERAMLLVTGRTERDLDRVFPGLVSHFDAVVTENGAVLILPGARRHTRLLHEPVDLAVDEALSDRGVGTDRGRVLVAISGADAATAADVITELGLDHQVVHNRGSAMILPAGVTKGSGLSAALGALGLSAHNTIAVGDAENDLTLLRAAEVGTAVADAVPSLAAHADLVLTLPDGAGVKALLDSPVLAGREPVWSSRRRITVGELEDGSSAWVPGSQASVLITGESGSGKSYLAGLLAERWLDAGYVVLVIDPEGDHVGLAERPDVLLVDAATDLPAPHLLLSLLGPHVSVVLDLSRLEEETRLAYLHRLPPEIAAARSRRGIPHWVIYDEAHEQTSREQSTPIIDGIGSCLVTWRPELLDAAAVRRADVVIHVGDSVAPAPGAERGVSLTAVLDIRGASTPFVVGPRLSDHVRHQHKYGAAATLPPTRRFYFKGQGTGDAPVAAATLLEFHDLLGHVDAATVAYHAARGDFSRWVGTTLADQTLSRELAHIERDLATRQSAAVQVAREQIQHAVRRRYLRPDTADHPG